MKIYYHDYYTDEGIDTYNPREADLPYTLDIFYNLTDEENNFFGIVDGNNRCIQFAWENQDKWLVDIPNPPSDLNYQTYADYDGCIAMIKDVYQLNKVVRFEGMVEVDAMKETLNEVLRKSNNPGYWVKTPVDRGDKSGTKSEYQVETKNMKSGKKNFDDYDPNTKEFIDYKDWNNGYPPKTGAKFDSAVKDAETQARIAQEHGTITRWEVPNEASKARIDELIKDNVDRELQPYIKVVVNPK
ncbi:hypothetical protein ABIB40_003199 [Pedobacter sp. UYP30]|uniref:hypothetical protein n=1 Tax=Pedobacter sp. UYP30 TaxID=1756400 RepID=UPI0033968A77